ncbi:MAG: S9 family peptidase [Acidimicrobiales bacterium]|nr:S9 family peptidase [Acidimicrobiales bacterium]
MAEHKVIAEQLIDGRSWVSQPAVSPDGKSVACVVHVTSLEKNKTYSQVWLNGAPLTGGDHDSSPTWSPAGDALAFTSRRGEKTGECTLHVLPITGPGELRTLCSLAEGIDAPSYSPDGKWLAFLSRTPSEDAKPDDEALQPARKIERFVSHLNGDGWIFDRPMHLYIVAADGTGSPRNLTPGPYQHGGIAWLPDSSGIVTAAARHETWDIDHAEDLYLVSLKADVEPVRLTDGTGRYARPAVSPNGTKLAFVGSTDRTVFPVNDQVLIGSPTTPEQPSSSFVVANAPLDRTFDPTVGAPAPIWTDNASLLAVAEDRGETHLFRLTLGQADPVEKVTSGPVTVTGASWDSGTLATVQTRVDHVEELFIGDKQVTSVGDSIGSLARTWERFSVDTADGTEQIDAWIMRPADFDPERRYPVLLNVHGGPFTQYGEYFFDEAQMQAAAGFVVVMGNPRGGSGRHTEWGQAILGPKHAVGNGTGWGSVDVDDVIAILDAALANYRFCDADRVGMLGGSYGGYMATWLAAKHGSRFKGICSERAVNNLTSLEWSSDIATLFHLEHGVSHLEDPEFYRERSPITYVDEISVPMLIIHSEEDWRCPIAQAEELWVALRLLNKDVDFYRFPGENHELSRSGSPFHRVQRAQIILDWFKDKLDG